MNDLVCSHSPLFDGVLSWSACRPSIETITKQTLCSHPVSHFFLFVFAYCSPTPTDKANNDWPTAIRNVLLQSHDSEVRHVTFAVLLTLQCLECEGQALVEDHGTDIVVLRFGFRMCYVDVGTAIYANDGSKRHGEKEKRSNWHMSGETNRTQIESSPGETGLSHLASRIKRRDHKKNQEQHNTKKIPTNKPTSIESTPPTKQATNHGQEENQCRCGCDR